MKKTILHFAFYTFFILTILIPFSVFGQEFVPLVGIPGIKENEQDIGPYINALFTLAIAAAAILAVIKIILAGVKYMFSEVVGDKSQAKKDILGAILGLLLILGSITVLNEINPSLTNFKIFRNATPVTVTEGANACPAGQVWMECEENSGTISATCGSAGDTSWCDGTVVEVTNDVTLSPSEGSWTKTVTATDVLLPSIAAGPLSDQCTRENGSPTYETIGNTVKVTCIK